MNATEFKRHGKEMVDYIIHYLQTVEHRRVTPDVKPGYMRKLLPSKAPEKPERWESIFSDIERVIMPGITHWQHPRFHAYFPAGNAYPSILGDMLSDAIGCIGFSWAASPACTELETIVLDWVGRMIGLPRHLLSLSDGARGGGVIQGSASECILVSLLAARTEAMRKLKCLHPDIDEYVLLSKLVAYCSTQTHSSAEKAGRIAYVRMRLLPTDDKGSLRGKTVDEAMKRDKKNGLIPIYVCGTLGTTASCAFDNLKEIGYVCIKNNTWFHVDAAYAGSAFICPEFRYLLEGIEYVTSLNINPNKWMLVNFDCSLMWIKDRSLLINAFDVDPVYLRHENAGVAIDYRHWGIPLSRRFRSLKIWFVVRSYGVDGLRKYIRNHVKLAKKFEALVLTDSRFEVIGDVVMGLVCFRLKGRNALTENLVKTINASGRIHITPASLGDMYIIRFALCHEHACEADVVIAWKIIVEITDDLLNVSDVTSHCHGGARHATPSASRFIPSRVMSGAQQAESSSLELEKKMNIFPWKFQLSRFAGLGT
uniref:Aromatic-L-amino-acid decarboxylase-like n=1 Tax=Saccoglossus kowalevskii TaxID=10224 RepID=A0ABM0GKF7_SACKO|nr:PREDICTED: aromatic-L-amino-acid decarboxylase-like [Saccoglossus kowalevskii]